MFDEYEKNNEDNNYIPVIGNGFASSRTKLKFENNSNNSCYFKNTKTLLNENLNESLPVTKDTEKNKKLVNLLEQKIFKGFMKIKAIKNFRAKTDFNTVHHIYAAGKPFRVKRKSQIKREEEERMSNLSFLKIEKYDEKKLYKNVILKNEEILTSNSPSRLFVTQKFNNTSKNKKFNKFYKNNNSNFEESVTMNKLSFLAFDIKRPKFKEHYHNQKTKFEKEIFKEIEFVNKNNNSNIISDNNNTYNNTGYNSHNSTDHMWRLSKNENMFKTFTEFEKTKTKFGYMDMRTNPGIIRGFLHSKNRVNSKSASKNEPKNSIFNNYYNQIKNGKILVMNNSTSNSNSYNNSKMISNLFNDGNEKINSFYIKNNKEKNILFSNEQLRKKNKINDTTKMNNKLKSNFDFYKELTLIPDKQIDHKSIENKYLHTDKKDDSDSFVHNKLTKTKNDYYNFNKLKSHKDAINKANNTFQMKIHKNYEINSKTEKSHKIENSNSKNPVNISNSRHTNVTFIQKTFDKVKSKEELFKRQNRSRDYIITKHLYRMYDKKDVDAKIYGRGSSQ